MMIQEVSMDAHIRVRKLRYQAGGDGGGGGGGCGGGGGDGGDGGGEGKGWRWWVGIYIIWISSV